MWYILDESGTYGAECSRKGVSGKKVAGAMRFLFNARDLQLECARVFHETLFVPVLMYGSETCYGRRRRDLELGMCRWTTSEDW